MAVVRVCSLLVLLVCVDSIAGKPFLDFLWCEWMCDEYDDDSTSTSTTSADYFDSCSDCRPRRRPPTTTQMPSTAMAGPAPASGSNINLVMPSNGIITWTNTGMGWSMQFAPIASPAAAGSSVTQVTTSVAPAATPATAATTAAPGATTAAPGATTAAPGATTAAPAATTAAARK